jgi:hypothetical protein
MKHMFSWKNLFRANILGCYQANYANRQTSGLPYLDGMELWLWKCSFTSGL